MAMSRRGLLALGVATTAMAAGGSAFAADPRPFEARALTWVRDNARAFPADPAIADLRPMVERLGEARVIGIGEATHGTHEDFAFKAMLIRALVTYGGVRCVALEANLSAGLAIDDYVRKGEGDVAAVMSKSGLFQNWQSEEFGALFVWLRAWNLAGKEPVRIIAIDCQATPADAFRALEWLAAASPSEAEPLRARLAPILTPEKRKSRLLEVIEAMTMAEHAGYLAALVDLKAAIGRQKDAPGKGAAIHSAETARQGLLVFDRNVKGSPDEEPPAEYWARRDRFMADNLITLARGDRAALHAHNSHVLPVPFEDKPDADGSQGLYLRRKLGRGYQTVSFEYDQGDIHAKLMKKGAGVPGRDAPWIVARRPSRPDGLGGFFARTGLDRFWLDLSVIPPVPDVKAWMEHPYQHDWPGFVVREDSALGPNDKGPVAGIVDLMVFFRTVTPSRFYDYVQQA